MKQPFFPRSPPPPPSLLLSHFRRLLSARQAKSFRKDLKLASSLSGPDAVAFEFMRANMEYLRGNHRKAVKLLLNNVKMDPEEKGSWDYLERVLPSLHSNALGCAHLAMGKPEVAIFHFRSAVEMHTEAVLRSDGSNFRQRPDFLHQVHRNEMAYNAATCLLHRGEPSKAFSTFRALSSSPGVAASPHLWLRMAECCIAEDAKRNQREGEDFKEIAKAPEAKSSSSTSSSLARPVGEGRNRKMVLQQQQQQQQQSQQQQPPSPLKQQQQQQQGGGGGRAGCGNSDELVNLNSEVNYLFPNLCQFSVLVFFSSFLWRLQPPA